MHGATVENDPECLITHFWKI